MARQRHEDLAHWGSGPIRIRNQRELDLILACRAPLADEERVHFVGLRWDDDEDRMVAVKGFVPDAAQQVIAAGILPAPADELPTIGDRVETIEVGGRPSPAGRYGVGTVASLEWDDCFGTWRVEVEFDRCTGGWQGYPLYGTSTFPWMVHVIGSAERPFSDMTPEEIEALYQARLSQQPDTQRPRTRAAETSNENDVKVTSRRDRALAHFEGGTINIWTQEALDSLLACPPDIAVEEHVSFTGRLGRDHDAPEGRWVADAISQVVSAGVLPAPGRVLPRFGTRVETIALANRQSPRYRCAVGSVDWITWSDGSWHVSVRFDTPVDMRRGGRLVNFSSPPSMVRVIASTERPFSDMTPREIKELFESLRQPAEAES